MCPNLLVSATSACLVHVLITMWMQRLSFRSISSIIMPAFRHCKGICYLSVTHFSSPITWILVNVVRLFPRLSKRHDFAQIYVYLDGGLDMKMKMALNSNEPDSDLCLSPGPFDGCRPRLITLLSGIFFLYFVRKYIKCIYHIHHYHHQNLIPIMLGLTIWIIFLHPHLS